MRRRAFWHRALLWALLLALLGLASFAAGRLWRIARDERAAEALLQSMKNAAAEADAAGGGEAKPPAGESADVGARPEAHACPVDFEAVQALYPDVVAWLTGCGGEIDTPLVQGRDNLYYLDHLPDGARNMLGTPFLDSMNSAVFSDDQSFVFGHHMDTGGGVFAPLLRYQEQAYFDRHPSFALHTPGGCYTAEVFSAYVVREDAYPFIREFSGPEAFSAFAAQAAAQSDIVCGVQVQPGDRVLTLATCTAKTSELRYVVCARLAPQDAR